MNVLNPFHLKKLNEYVIWKENKRIPNVIVVNVLNPFHLKKLNEYVIWKENKRIPNVIV